MANWPRSIRYDARRSGTRPIVKKFNRTAKSSAAFGVLLTIMGAKQQSVMTVLVGIIGIVGAVIVSFRGGIMATKLRRGVKAQLDPLLDTLPPKKWMDEVTRLFQYKGWATLGVDESASPVLALRANDPDGQPWTIFLLPPQQTGATAPLGQLHSTTPWALVIERTGQTAAQKRESRRVTTQFHMAVWSRSRVTAEFTNMILNRTRTQTAPMAKTTS